MTQETRETANSVRLRDVVTSAVHDLLNSGESVNLRRESRRVFERACLNEVLWESFVDEWIDAAYELAGERTSVLDYHELTDWCTCGHSSADHAYMACDLQTCDCAKFKRSRKLARPKPRHVAEKYSALDINRARCIELENANYRHVFGDLIADDIKSAGGAR